MDIAGRTLSGSSFLYVLYNVCGGGRVCVVSSEMQNGIVSVLWWFLGGGGCKPDGIMPRREVALQKA